MADRRDSATTNWKPLFGWIESVRRFGKVAPSVRRQSSALCFASLSFAERAPQFMHAGNRQTVEALCYSALFATTVAHAVYYKGCWCGCI
ncbi:hypothetical protein TYRP_010608 [Tyrophagus putrescentiae]|nr:hypothetical protein TYRP_010608 [Tyrophagus putrescentiae]